jgi:predicted nucleotidyltransferase
MNKKDYLNLTRGVLSRRGKVDYAFLFGSALKQLRPDSDIDILIGGRLKFGEKTDLAMDLAIRLKRDVDIVLVSEASCELALNVFSRGKPIMIKSQKALKKDYFRNFHLYEQTDGLRALRIARIKREFGNG